MYVCMSVSKCCSASSDTQTPLLPIFPLVFIQVSFVHDLPYTFHPVFLRSSSCSLLKQQALNQNIHFEVVCCVLDTTTSQGLHSLGLESWQGQGIFFSPKPSGLVLGADPATSSWVPEVLPSGVKWLGCEVHC